MGHGLKIGTDIRIPIPIQNIRFRSKGWFAIDHYLQPVVVIPLHALSEGSWSPSRALTG